jgi:hypothetical protein
VRPPLHRQRAFSAANQSSIAGPQVPQAAALAATLNGHLAAHQAPVSSLAVRDQSILHAQPPAASQDPAALALVRALVHGLDSVHHDLAGLAVHAPVQVVHRLPAKLRARNVPLPEDAADVRSIPRRKKAR